MACSRMRARCATCTRSAMPVCRARSSPRARTPATCSRRRVSRTCSTRSSTACGPSASTCAASPRRTRSWPARGRSVSSRRRRPCSRTRSRACRRAARAASAVSSASTGRGRRRRLPSTARTWSSATWPSCFERCGRYARRVAGRQHRGCSMIRQSAFPAEPWAVRETSLELEHLAQTESVFALGNGHIGLRGNLDEGEPFGLPGTYLSGFYEVRPLPYAESAYGQPEAGQTIVNVTNGKIIRLLVEDESFDVRYGELRSHERVLDLRDGVLRRTAEWVSPSGRAVRVSSTRLVSFTQ